MFFTPPVPLGVFTTKVSGYVLVTYDNYGRVSNVASGVTSKMFGEKEGLMLKEGDLNFVIEKFGPRGLQLIIQSTRLLEYLELNGDAPECTFVLACERQITMQAQGWYETCPDRVVIDAGEPFNLQPLLTECTPDTCPDTIVPIGSGHVLVPLLYPVVLPAGRHQLELSSSIYKGQSKSVFECEQGQVLYGTIHGSLTKHWWSPRYSTINTFVSFSVIPPSDLKSYSALLYSNNHWLIGQKPLKITK